MLIAAPFRGTREDATLTREIVQEAQRLREAGRFAEAEAAYRRALASDPNQATCWYNLGFVQRQQGRVEEALASYGEALKRGVSRPEEVHLNRAAIYADYLRREDEAERELNAALRLNSAYTPALFNLGNLNEDRGRRQEAAALYERVLALDPAAFEALARLANIAVVTSRDDAIVARDIVNPAGIALVSRAQADSEHARDDWRPDRTAEAPARLMAVANGLKVAASPHFDLLEVGPHQRIFDEATHSIRTVESPLGAFQHLNLREIELRRV